MKWIKTEDRLPPAGKYVLGRHNRGTWHDPDDQENVNCVVVKLVKGISKEDRKKMEAGELPDPMESGIIYPDGVNPKTVYSTRSNEYRTEDEWNNNKKPYCWQQFGPDHFWGQSIYAWMPIPKEDE